MTSDPRDRLAKGIFLTCIVIGALGLTFLLGGMAHRLGYPPFPHLNAAYASLFQTGGAFGKPLRFEHLQPSRGQGDGVTVNDTAGRDDYVLLAGFFEEENQIRLMTRDGTVVRKWPLDYLAHFDDPATRPCEISSPLRTDTHGAHVTPQGEIVFNYEYCGTVKLDQCGEMMWRIDLPTHHSLIPAETGGYWILGSRLWSPRANPDRFPPFSAAQASRMIREDTVMRVSEEGEVLEEFSIPDLMRTAGLMPLLTATGRNFRRSHLERDELVHANKLAELSSEIADAFPLFEAGDLAISMRQLNLVMVVDPETREVKWHQTGPWIRQHDPEFREDGRISVFNNNAFRTAYVDEQTDLDTPFTTNIIAIDPVTRATEIVYGERPGQEMLSVIRGQHEVLGDGGLLIIEFDAGRVLEVDAAGRTVWEYVNAYDDMFVGEVTNARLYAADYFETDWAPCGS